jgi:cell division septation protein DedD
MATKPESPEKMTLDRSDGSATIDLYRAALGPFRADYYLKAFTRFDAAGKSGPSWNWAAALLSLNWMLFRKLWIAALAYVGVVVAATLLVFGIGRLVFQLTPETQWLLLALGGLLAIVIPGAYGNAWLYAYCNQKMERALAACVTLEEAYELLAREAISFKRLVLLTGLNGSLGLLIAAALLSWPQRGALPQQADPVSHAHVEGLVQNGPAAPPLVAAVTASEVQGIAKEPANASASPKPEEITPTSDTTKAAQLTTAEPAAKTTAEKAGKAGKAEKADKADKADKAAKRAKADKAATKAAEKSLANSGIATLSAPDAEKFLINVGLFADDNNARNAFVKLQDAGLPVVSQEVKSNKGKRTRVRVGPFDTQSEADQAAERIRALQLEAVVFKP